MLAVVFRGVLSLIDDKYLGSGSLDATPEAKKRACEQKCEQESQAKFASHCEHMQGLARYYVAGWDACVLLF